MAVLKMENGKTYTDIEAISREFSQLNIEVAKLPLHQYLVNRDRSNSIQKLCLQETLNLAHKQEILQSLSHKFVSSDRLNSCTWCELIAVNPSSPHLYQLMAQGSRPGKRENDDLLYVLTGECVLGFTHPHGFLMEILLQAQEYIKVPAGIRHWFSLSALLQVKAIRYAMAGSSHKKCYL